DKYSTRKIVNSNLGKWLENDEINTLIYQEFFEFDVEKSVIPEIPLEDRLDDEDLNTLRLVTQLSESDIKQNVEQLIEEINK
ncbi:hypothetical protein, partial [Aliivibrio kagoshimensis]|uniref:hypothetical protein n=1 Tax=Aliivibrio kagoshimensis TaxID=2910230 RepID=UPI003D122DE8